MATPFLIPFKMPLIVGATAKAYGAAIPAIAGAAGAGVSTIVTAPFTLKYIAKGPIKGAKTAAIMSLPFVVGKKALLQSGIMLR